MLDSRNNLIKNGDFQKGKLNALPEFWKFCTPRPSLSPIFRFTEWGGDRYLMATGGGNPDCVGLVWQDVGISLGKTYKLSVQFKFSEDLNPHHNLLFQCFGDNTMNGIFDFRRTDGWASGDVKIHYPGSGKGKVQARIVFRFSPHGRAWIKNISLVEAKPDKPLFVRVACTQGKPDLVNCRAVLELVGRARVDIILLPEYMQGKGDSEPIDGPCGLLMSEMAKEYGMYVAGGIVRQDDGSDRLFNSVLLYNRMGLLTGIYDKIHPYSPEFFDPGITPGRRIPIFTTDFGKIGFMICYDGWFTDVAEGLALKGAEIIFFPNVGYYRSLMPARASDNCERIVASSWNNGYGIWDTAGREVTAPDADPSHKPIRGETFRNVKKERVDDLEILMVDLDLRSSPSPAYNGGTMMSAPGGKRNRREQLLYLDDVIKAERSRWWID